MPWVYQQASGSLSLNTIFIGAGYAGHGSGLNNPAAQDQQNVGPIPTGTYSIGPAHTPVDHLGPLARNSHTIDCPIAIVPCCGGGATVATVATARSQV